MKKNRLVFLASILALAGLAGCNKNDINGISENDLKVTSVTLDVSYQKLEVGESLTLTPTISYKDDQEVECYKEWKTSNSKVATVSDAGMVLALKTGRAAITFIAGYKSASCSIEVPSTDIYVDPTTPEEGEETQPGEFTIKINSKNITLKTGATYQLTATTSEPANVSWSSSDEAVATVSQSGLVTAKAEGVATIHATSNGKSVSCEVTVTDEQQEVLPEDEDMTVHIYFFIDYNNVDEEDTTGKKLLTHFWWYEDKPIAESGKVPANPTTAPTPDFPYFAGWSNHAIIDSKDGLLDLTTYKVSDDGSRQFLYIYGIWTDVQGGMTK